ncbi:MAG: Gfo/Idh/MocA family oxidoreductase [Vicinamibacterales bacterium]
MRVGVVGVGHLGQHHARIFAAMDGVELVGVADTNPQRAEEIAAKHGTRAFTGLLALMDEVDAVTIAVPTVTHLEAALPFLERRKAVLVEKPLAASVGEADRLIAAAEQRGAILAVGHTERFNPAVEAARPLIDNPRFIEVHRLGTFRERSLDIDVIFDLMIHDLDLLLALVRSEVVSVEAVGVNVLTSRTDIANARIRFASGCIANLTASRISRDRVRKIRFFQHRTYVSIDYAAREVEVYTLVPPPSSPDRGGLGTAGGPESRPAIQGGKLPVADDEPLRRELADFVDAARTGRSPGVTGREGRDALALAAVVADRMTETV